MQSQNNHIENLVRQAAEYNPVKAKGADWESVYNRLQTKEEASGKAEQKSKKYLFLLLFLLSSLLCNEFYYILYSDHLKNDLITNPLNLPINGRINTELLHVTNTNEKVVRDNFRSLKNYNNPVNAHESAIGLELVKQILGEDATNDETVSVNRLDDVNREVIVSAVHEDVVNNLSSKTSEEIKPEEHSIPVKTESAKQKRFYAAFLLGPDISTVKFSEIKAAGHSIGITAGINLSKRFSIETGAFLDQKKYVAEGEYFKEEKLYLPDHSKLLNVSGYCNMIEIPLNIRYNVATTPNYNLFALAGASSYLLQKENYDYEYTRYNNLYSSNKSYRKSSNEFFNVINLAAGFEKRVGKTTALRIEPYVKLPVRGMGVGEMRLSSAGVLVGIRYPF